MLPFGLSKASANLAVGFGADKVIDFSWIRCVGGSRAVPSTVWRSFMNVSVNLFAVWQEANGVPRMEYWSRGSALSVVLVIT